MRTEAAEVLLSVWLIGTRILAAFPPGNVNRATPV